MLSFRVRGPSGQATLSDVDPSSSVAAFMEQLGQKTGLPPTRQEVLAGFPPKLVDLPADRSGSLSQLGLQRGDLLTVRELPGAPPAPPANGGANIAPAGMSEDEQLAQAIALSLGQEAPPPPQQQRPASAPPRAHPPAAPRPGAAVTEVPMADGTALVRRIIDSDNSCLFNSVGYAMHRSRALAPRLRVVIATAVQSSPDEWSEAVLGKAPGAYCDWITRPSSWGGAIELSILSKHFGREIAAFDIQTERCDVYGQGDGYSERVLVVYDGLHYDTLAVAAGLGAPESGDTTVLPASGPRTDAAMAAAAALVASAHAARGFTDVANFTLRCGACQIGLRGEKEAVQHAKESGHTNFSEY